MFDLAFLVSMASGTAVVASRIGGLPEIVTPESGVLVSPGDAVELAKTMSALWNNREQTLRVGASAWKRASQHFEVNQQSMRVAALYEELLSNEPKSGRRP